MHRPHFQPRSEASCSRAHERRRVRSGSSEEHSFWDCNQEGKCSLLSGGPLRFGSRGTRAGAAAQGGQVRSLEEVLRTAPEAIVRCETKARFHRGDNVGVALGVALRTVFKLEDIGGGVTEWTVEDVVSQRHATLVADTKVIADVDPHGLAVLLVETVDASLDEVGATGRTLGVIVHPVAMVDHEQEVESVPQRRVGAWLITWTTGPDRCDFKEGPVDCAVVCTVGTHRHMGL